MNLMGMIMKMMRRKKESEEPSEVFVKAEVLSEEEKCAETMRKLNQKKAEKIEAARRCELRKKTHLARCKKIRDFLKERPDRCFNNKLLAKELSAIDEEERIFFEEFSSDDMDFGGNEIEYSHEFCFFDSEGEEYFMYNSQ